MDTDVIESEDDLDGFLEGIGLRVDIDVVAKVVDALEGKGTGSKYDLYTYKMRRDGTERSPICSKATADKIDRLYQTGALGPYLAYRNRVASGEVPAAPGQPVAAEATTSKSKEEEIIERRVNHGSL